MIRTILFSTTVLMTSAVNAQHGHNHGHQHQQEAEDSTETANDFMHSMSMEELIERFESPERDAYQQPEKVLEYLGKLKGKKVIDIGAGTGYFSVKLAEKGANVIAADVNDDFQKVIQERIEENEISNIELRKLPFDSPNLKAEEVDIALIVNTYHHIDNREAYFAEVKKGIKKNGSLVLIDFFKTDVPVGPPVGHKISIDQVTAELKKAGFTEFEVTVDLLPYQYIIKAK